MATSDDEEPLGQEPDPSFLARRSQQPQFTLRALLVGLAVGIVIAFSNTYFGLQTGWISGMAMPSALIGFAYFRIIRGLTGSVFGQNFSEVENVLVQTVAGSVGTMPLGCGFVGVIPALEFLLQKDETPQSGLNMSLGRLTLWALGLCFFGVAFAVPLRKEVIIREKLRFPSGTATALMISVLHGGEKAGVPVGEEGEALIENISEQDPAREWIKQLRLLIYSFAGSGIYTLVSYFVPALHALPIFGARLARDWLWRLNPSPAYVGQGIIMGPETTMHMLFGCILGWAVLSPMAKHRGWAPGDVADWNTGSKGWIVWVSLAIMLADSLVNLAWLATKPALKYLRNTTPPRGFSFVEASQPMEETEADSPPDHLIPPHVILPLLLLSLLFCVVAINLTFPHTIPWGLTLLSLPLALLLSLIGVRAQGETDLNPVSGISKLTQLLIALVTPPSPASIPTNLIAGAISEAGALQAGDLLQDLKTGHLLGASPKAQFYGQMIGSAVGACVSAAVYKLYTHVYEVPGGVFQTPTAYVWVFTARLVTGKGLPEGVGQVAAVAGMVWAGVTVIRIWGGGRRWVRCLPGGVAVAVGMYNPPSFTLARAVGGLGAWWCGKGEEMGLVVLASGLIMGEGVISILTLGLRAMGG
ncbi:OPT superfamily oligopeptide transporter [Piedraia hortae CBS 480.64]|uniref:OPT superfamily oligopeptide transporter n=1 Tax=Piedraia hortae CBS 480.64 TaxID=1314780 RepID=A0A6A7C9R6_9PEZI|nr:OPT superfamily oligopeptide transporter [Piedraia hortae CBS 480.64]